MMPIGMIILPSLEMLTIQSLVGHMVAPRVYIYIMLYYIIIYYNK